jgi:nicotinate-nucleotide adenylyltransferase
MGGLIGVFGGSFDPPHYGHLRLAGEARRALGLDPVLWVVTASPPHKPAWPLSPINLRLEMVRAALEDQEGFELSLADVDRQQPHYAVGTIEWLQAKDPEARYVYVLGSDSLSDLPKWHQPQLLVSRVWRLGVLRRPGANPDLQALESAIPGIGNKVEWIEAPQIDISSREIRRRVREGLPYQHLLPPAVAALIEGHGLYQ